MMLQALVFVKLQLDFYSKNERNEQISDLTLLELPV